MSTYDIAVIGAGYVGMPHAQTFAEAGKKVVLVDVVQDVVDAINRGESHIEDVPSEKLKPLVESGAIVATTDFAACRRRRRDRDRRADAALAAARARLSVRSRRRLGLDRAAPARRASSSCSSRPPTPARPARSCSRSSSSGSGLKAGSDFHLAFAPERVDPGREDFTTKTTPKVVGGIDAGVDRRRRGASTAARSTRSTTVSSAEAAELTKLLENIFRSVNIALVNELAQLCDRMGIDVWEVVDAAATKPFGFMSLQARPRPRRPLHPARPVLPLVEGARVRLQHALRRARRRDQQQHAVLLPLGDLAGAEPRRAARRSPSSKILVLGVAYKSDIDDVRESPAEKIVELLRTAGADVAYHDPHVPEFDGHDLRAARARGLRLRRDRHRALVDRLRATSSERGEGDRRLPQRDQGRTRSTGRSGSYDAGRRRRARLLGPEPGAQLRRPRRS